MKGGGKSFLPLPSAVTNGTTLRENFNLFSITAHGSQTGNCFLVPENVYICFRGPAGASITRRRHQDEVLNRFRYKNAGETDEQYYDRLYTEIRDKTLFSEFLAKPEDPFEPGKMSIYEPGDVIQDINLQMKNLEYPYGLIGIWSAPLPHEYLDELNQLNDLYDSVVEDQLPSLYTMYAQLVHSIGRDPTTPGLFDILKPLLEKEREQQKRDLKAVVNPVIGEGEAAFFSKPENKVSQLGFPAKPSLHTLVVNMKISQGGNPPVASKPFTFIVIEACRADRELSEIDVGGAGGLVAFPEHITALEGRGSNAERNAALNAATRSLYKGKDDAIATISRTIRNTLPKTRRRSLAVRQFTNTNDGEVCFRSLFLLSKRYLQTLQPAAPADKLTLSNLLAGNLVTTEEVDKLTADVRAKNIQLGALPFAERFYPGEGVRVTNTGEIGIVKDVVVQPGGAGGGTTIGYNATVINPDTKAKRSKRFQPGQLSKMNQGEFKGLQMSLNTANQANLTYTRPRLRYPTIPIGISTGKQFYVENVDNKLTAEDIALIEKQMGAVSFEISLKGDGTDKLKFAIGERKGEVVTLLPELKFSLDPGPAQRKVRFQVRADNGSVSTINPLAFEQINKGMFSGGARKTRRRRAKGRGQSRKFLRGKFCRCIKKVRKTVKARGKGAKTAAGKEKAAIGICVKSVLGTRKRTLYKFSCKKGKLETQNPF